MSLAIATLIVIGAAAAYIAWHSRREARASAAWDSQWRLEDW